MQSSNLSDVLAALRAQMEEIGVDVDAIEEGSNHPYTCRCDTCRQWWRNIGPELDLDGDGNEVRTYGPFKAEEIEISPDNQEEDTEDGEPS